MLNLTASDEYDNRIFHFNLIDFNNNNTILAHRLAYVNAALKHVKTHNLICSTYTWTC